MATTLQSLPPALLDRNSPEFAELLGDYFHAESSGGVLGCTHGLTLLQLIAWKRSPVATQAISEILLFERERAHDLAARNASAAAQVLSNLLTTAPSPETARKAAAHLLRLALRPPLPIPARGNGERAGVRGAKNPDDSASQPAPDSELIAPPPPRAGEVPARPCADDGGGTNPPLPAPPLNSQISGPLPQPLSLPQPHSAVSNLKSHIAPPTPRTLTDHHIAAPTTHAPPLPAREQSVAPSLLSCPDHARGCETPDGLAHTSTRGPP